MDFCTKNHNTWMASRMLYPWEADARIAELEKENGDLRLMVAVLKAVIVEKNQVIQAAAKTWGEI